MASGIKFTFKGFDELLNNIQEAGGSIDKAVDSCMKQSAQTMQAELKSQMKASNVDSGLIARMPQPKIKKDGNRVTASVGYEKGNYDANNPSDAYKVIFLNYGTPRRSKHGKVKARGFIQNAKKSANKKIKKQQAETLNKILGRVKGK